jgi:hypothetical protein
MVRTALLETIARRQSSWHSSIEPNADAGAVRTIALTRVVHWNTGHGGRCRFAVCAVCEPNAVPLNSHESVSSAFCAWRCFGFVGIRFLPSPGEN